MDGYQLDGEPNLYIENGWKSPFPSIDKQLALGFQVNIRNPIKLKPYWAIGQTRKPHETSTCYVNDLDYYPTWHVQFAMFVNTCKLGVFLNQRPWHEKGQTSFQMT